MSRPQLLLLHLANLAVAGQTWGIVYGLGVWGAKLALGMGANDIDGTVSLARDGLWQGTIKANHVIISGHVEGDIVAQGKVEISNSAKITGTVTGEAIAVAEGAIVEGQMKTTGQPAPVGFVEKRGND